MTEIRLTFAAEGFEAVSKVLVEMGIGFHVEPVGDPGQDRRPAPGAAPAAKRRAPAKAARKASKAKRAARPASRGCRGDRVPSACARPSPTPERPIVRRWKCRQARPATPAGGAPGGGQPDKPRRRVDRRRSSSFLAGQPAFQLGGVRQAAGVDQLAVDRDARRRHHAGLDDRLRVGDLLDLDFEPELRRRALAPSRRSLRSACSRVRRP